MQIIEVDTISVCLGQLELSEDLTIAPLLSFLLGRDKQ